MDVFKVGCTERPPHVRAWELSRATGVPSPFDVVCYIEVVDQRSIEREMHLGLAGYRLNCNREFFEIDGLGEAIATLFFSSHALSFGWSDLLGIGQAALIKKYGVPHPYELLLDQFDAPKLAYQRGLDEVDALVATRRAEAMP
jgi:hypothetical protein